MLLWQLPACHPATIGYAKIGSSRKAKLPFLHSRDGLAKRYCWLTIPLMRPFPGIRGEILQSFKMRMGCRSPGQPFATFSHWWPQICTGENSGPFLTCKVVGLWSSGRMTYGGFPICNNVFVIEWSVAVENKSNVYYHYSQNIPYMFVSLLRYVSVLPVLGGAI